MCTTLRIDMVRTGKQHLPAEKKKKGITVRQIQEEMGFNTPQAIFKWIRGESLPTLDNMIVLSEMFCGADRTDHCREQIGSHEPRKRSIGG